MKKEHKNEKIVKEKNECFHCRELITNFIQSNPNIKSMSFMNAETFENSCDITFSVSINDMGLDRSTCMKYEKEFFSSFMINFLGEFLVRENINKFVELTSKVKPQDFIKEIASKIHKKFGVTIQGDLIKFTFHISLLSKILTEDLKSLDY